LELPTAANCEPDTDELFLSSLPPQPSSIECDENECPNRSEIGNLDMSLNASIDLDDDDYVPVDKVTPVLSPVDSIEECVVVYISGYVIRKVNTPKACKQCIELCTVNSPNLNHSLVTMKEFKPGCMYKTSQSVAMLCTQFEVFFQLSTAQNLPYPHPRQSIVSSFLTKHCALISSRDLNCPQNHKDTLILSILNQYCTLRIHHFVKAALRKSKKNKKGAELNKCKKLNIL
jgi:hypothetical protein